MTGRGGPTEGDASTGAEEFPEASGGFFEQLVESAGDAVVTANADGVVVYANDAVESLLGYDPERVRGQSLVDFVPGRLEDRYREWLARFAAGDGGTPLDGDAFEATWLAADGEEKRLSVSVFQHGADGRRLFTGVLRELPDAGRRAERIREDEALIDEIFDTSPIAISVRDADGELLRANARAAGLIGLDDPSRAVEEGSVADGYSLHAPDGEPISFEDHPVGRVLRTGESVSNEEVVLEGPSGDRTHLSVSTAPIYRDGELHRVVTAAEDVTELKESQLELERRRAELETELAEVFRRVTDAFFALNDDWEFTYVNDTAEELLWRTEGDLVGRNVWEAFPEAADTAFRREYERAMERQEPVSFVELYPPLSRWFEVRAYPSETGLSVYFRDVTERREREQQLERYETIMETVEDGVYALDPDERFVMVNDAFVEMTGYDREQLLGEHASVVHSDAINERAAEMSESVADELGSTTLEFDLRAKDGDTLPVESRFGPYRYEDGRLARTGVVRDVTERRRFEQTLTALHESSRKLLQLETDEAVAASVLQTATDVLDIPGANIYLSNEDGSALRPAATSEYIRELFGEMPTLGPGDEAVTWRAFADREPITLDDVRETDLPYRRDTPLRSGVWIPLGDHGVLAVVSEEVAAFDPKRRELADLLAATAEAALDRVERERQRREHERQLEAQNERLDAFASMLAHELRNPLEIAQIYLDMGVESAPTDADAARSFREVEQALDRIEEMIDTLLVVTRQSGDLYDAEVVDLGEAAAEWWAAMEDRDGTLDVLTDRRVRADSSRLRQLLENLYRNAEEHAGPDVTVRVGDLESGFYVEDDGPGVSEETRERVFEPGYSTSNVGIGFGLAVVGQLAEAHGWDYEVTESESGGARFEFRGVDVVDEE